MQMWPVAFLTIPAAALTRTMADKCLSSISAFDCRTKQYSTVKKLFSAPVDFDVLCSSYLRRQAIPPVQQRKKQMKVILFTVLLASINFNGFGAFAAESEPDFECKNKVVVDY